MYKIQSIAASATLSMFLALPSVHAMGPDPGGHTGDKVTPQTTKTDRPYIDAQREQASGTRTETNRGPGAGPAERD